MLDSAHEDVEGALALVIRLSVREVDSRPGSVLSLPGLRFWGVV